MIDKVECILFGGGGNQSGHDLFGFDVCDLKERPLPSVTSQRAKRGFGHSKEVKGELFSFPDFSPADFENQMDNTERSSFK